MGAKVDRAIGKVQAKVGDKGRAIAILKSQGTIKQSGRHLVSGAGKGSKRKGGSK